MSQRPRALSCVAVAMAVLATACGRVGTDTKPVLAPPAAPVASVPAVAPAPSTQVPDAEQALIAASQARFEQGQAELRLGHLERAKSEFNRALDLLLESPDGARAHPRVQEHFDRLVDRISAYEIRALVEGDGFAEQPQQPASLDELLALSTFDLPAPKPELKNAVELDLKSTVHDVPIPLNSRVLAYIELFQGRLRDWFQAALQRGQAYMPMIQRELRAEGLPLDLAFVPIVESAFHTQASSRAKARGFWQLMRGTAVEQGLKHDWYIDERSDPDKATRAAVGYMKFLNRMFKGDWHLTLASYNGGPGTVQRAVRRKGVADFWILAEKGRYLPRETRDYVPMVLAAMVVARNPAQYGFSVQPVDLVGFESVALPGAVDLRRVAEWAGVPVDEVQRLNPELRRLTTPLRSDGYPLRVPVGTASQVAAELAAAAPDGLAALQYHTVKRGESIVTIANKLRVRRADLADANYLSAKARVKPGDRLVIPRAPTTLLTARADRPSPVTPARAITADVSSAPGGRVADGARAKLTYRVRKGDTLSSIARAFRTTVAELRSWNRLTGSRIDPGDRLTVYATRDPGGAYH
jgi:membrane-bound lytic murein transglycosylase D